MSRKTTPQLRLVTGGAVEGRGREIDAFRVRAARANRDRRPARGADRARAIAASRAGD